MKAPPRRGLRYACLSTILPLGLALLSAPVHALSAREIQCRDAPGERGIQACTKLIGAAKTPQQTRAYLHNRAQRYFLLQRCDLAVADYDRYIALTSPGTSDYVDGLLFRARQHQFCTGDLEAALRDLRQADAACPDPAVCSGVFSDLGVVLARTGDLAGAVTAYQRAIAHSPTPQVRATYINNRGTARIAAGDYDTAIADFSLAIDTDPTNPQPYANRGEAWRLKGQLDKAIADLDLSVDIAPARAHTRLLRCRAYRYIGDNGRAEADCSHAIGLAQQVKMEFPAALTERGLAYERQGKIERARADYAAALAAPGAGMDTTASAHETARARLAALDSGAPQPVIPAVPGAASSPQALPTPAIPAPSPAQGAATSPGRRVALVIGNASYAIGTLANPLADADAISKLLERLGFATVTVAKNTTREALVDALRSFATQAEAADWALVYFAGHGLEIGGTNYLIPTDAKLATDRDVQFEAVPLDQVLAAIEPAKALRLVFLDACRNNPFVAGMRRTASAPVAEQAGAAPGPPAGETRSIGRGLGRAKLGSNGGVLVFYAARHGQTALDGEGANSPFAVALAQRLATPGVELNKLLRLVRDDVMEATAGRQEPYTYGSLPGSQDFFFVDKP